MATAKPKTSKAKMPMKEVNKKPEMGPMPNKVEMGMMSKGKMMMPGMPPKGMGPGMKTAKPAKAAKPKAKPKKGK